MTTAKHFAAFQPHTLTKHAILDAYLKAWATILIPKFKIAWFVDAFAGEGQDMAGNPGSPLIAARVAQQINAKHFRSTIGPNTGMRVLAFESDPARFERLNSVMAPFIANPWHSGVAIVRQGTLDHKLEGVLKTIGESPALFFLDPFGIDGLAADVLPRLLEGTHNELLVLFNDEGAVRLAGKVRAGILDEATVLAQAEAAVVETLFGEKDLEDLRSIARSRAKKAVAGHKSNADAERIMNTAFGGDWWQPIINQTLENQRQAKFVDLYDSLLEKIGGTKRLRFSIDTPDGRHKYFLIHAAKDRRAYAVMKNAMHRARRKAGAGAGLLDSLLQDVGSGTDVKHVADLIQSKFAGRSVRWQGTDSCVKTYAVEETSLWLHDCDSLKQELLERGYTELNEKGKPKSPLTFNFPVGAIPSVQQDTGPM